MMNHTEEVKKGRANDEFIEGESEITGLQRREMLKLLGATAALAGAGVACRRPVEKILPYSKAPEEVIPGIPNYYATSMPTSFGAVGVVVESHEGRPTKIEGNPEHPASNGRASAHMQASILELYDPDRSRVPMKKQGAGRMPMTWGDWDAFAGPHFASLAADKGTGLAFLINQSVSPTAMRITTEVSKRFPNATWFAYDPLKIDSAGSGAVAVFGENARVRYAFEKAKVLLTVHADPLAMGADNLLHAKGFGEGRKIRSAKEASQMNRLYAVEAAYTITGANADHRLRIAASDGLDFLKVLAAELVQKQNAPWPSLLGGEEAKRKFVASLVTTKKFDARFVAALAKDLLKNQGQALVVVGDNQSEATQGLGHVLNVVLGGVGKTFGVSHVVLNASIAKGFAGLESLVKKMNAGEVKTLVMVDVNPVYSAPGALQFAQALSKVSTQIHVGLYEDETGLASSWHLPQTHFLESWGDGYAYDRTISISQPLIAPLYHSRSGIEILAQIGALSKSKGHDLVQETWRQPGGLLAADAVWRKTLHDGFVAQSAEPEKSVSAISLLELLPKMSVPSEVSPSKDSLEILFKNDYSVLDGRFANLGWLQEMPDPMTKLVWDNALLVGPKLARELGIKSCMVKRIYEADEVELTLNGQSVKTPTFVMPGLADYSVVAFLGYGRKAAGVIGTDVGVDMFPLLPKDGGRYAGGCKLKLTGKTIELATTQEQFAMNAEAVQEITTFSMQSRDPARETTVKQYQDDPGYTKKKGLPEDLFREEGDPKKLMPLQVTTPWTYDLNKWGKVIDLTACIGCNACVVACQAENNIPVVGRTQAMRGRVMHWIRVDRYFSGDVENPTAIQQPVACMHCENAPCEPVCPVAATTHDKEGLNVMTYNRCVGTRYCANNCPYKVRRFNYFDFSHSGNLYVDPENKARTRILEMQANPDVTVRYRGVMEKCTYCVQRIQEAKIAATRNHQDKNALPDGVVTPACAQSCPTEAIIFGNLNDEKSRVTMLKQVDRNYDLLNELNTRPRTSYLAKLTNPNPELV